jgi:WYL_2, Sm-like SH3 beta-barrel fold
MELDRNNLIKNLQKHKLTILFVKNDGTLRSMLCTLRPDTWPPSEESATHKNNANTTNLIMVWDLEKRAWRSFHCDKIRAVLQVDDGDE